MKPTSNRLSRGKVAIILVIAAAVVFGTYIGYLGFANQSFPVEEKPFANYAAMASPPQFNGTEISFQVRWLNSDYVPVLAQISSNVTDTANSVACGTGLKNASAGEVIDMPFGLSSATITAVGVQLFIDVQPVVHGSSDFTIVYNIGSISASPGNVTPTSYACQESESVM